MPAFHSFSFFPSPHPHHHHQKNDCCHYGRNADPNSFYIRICLMTVLHFPQAHTNYKDMRGLIMRAKGSTCEETWFKMLSAGKAISSHQHCHGLSKTQPGLPSSKVQKHFFPPFLSVFFFLKKKKKKKGTEPTEIALVPSKKGRSQVSLHLLIVSLRWLFCEASGAQC